MPLRSPILPVLLLAAVVYAPVLGHDFLSYDDPGYVTQNARVIGGLSGDGARWAFTTFEQYNWHPLTWLSLQLDSTLFGLAPGPRHAMNVALHLLATGLLYAFLAAATGARWRSALVAALFALHPVNVQPVAWIAQRKDVLSAVFFMAGLLAYVRYCRRPSLARYALVFAACAAGLLSKAVGVTFPFVLLLLDAWPLARGGAGFANAGRLVVEKLPLFALVAALSAIELSAQAAGGAVVEVGFAQRLANAAVAIVSYLGLLIWPSGLSIHHSYVPDLLDDALPRVVGALAVLVAISVVAWRYGWTRRYPLVGWLWFLGMLVPMLGLVQVGMAAMADRYLYLPGVGIFLAVIWGGHELAARFGAERAAAVAAGFVCLAFAGASHVELRHWRDSEAVFTRALEQDDRNAVARIQLARLRSDGGQYAEAIALLQEAIRLEPFRWKAYNNLGNALQATGDLEGAVAAYQRALALVPASGRTHYNAGRALVALGRRREAAMHLQRAVTLEPGLPGAHLELANVVVLSDPGAALPLYEVAIAREPESYLAHYGMGHALAGSGRVAEAIPRYEHALSLRPGAAAVMNDLGIAYFSLGRTGESVAALEAAVAAEPGRSDYRFNLATAQAADGQRAAAVRSLERVLAERPEDAAARAFLAELQAAP